MVAEVRLYVLIQCLTDMLLGMRDGDKHYVQVEKITVKEIKKQLKNFLGTDYSTPLLEEALKEN